VKKISDDLDPVVLISGCIGCTRSWVAYDTLSSQYASGRLENCFFFWLSICFGKVGELVFWVFFMLLVCFLCFCCYASFRVLLILLSFFLSDFSVDKIYIIFVLEVANWVIFCCQMSIEIFAFLENLLCSAILLSNVFCILWLNYNY